MDFGQHTESPRRMEKSVEKQKPERGHKARSKAKSQDKKHSE